LNPKENPARGLPGQIMKKRKELEREVYDELNSLRATVSFAGFAAEGHGEKALDEPESSGSLVRSVVKVVQFLGRKANEKTLRDRSWVSREKKVRELIAEEDVRVPFCDAFRRSNAEGASDKEEYVRSVIALTVELALSENSSMARLEDDPKTLAMATYLILQQSPQVYCGL